ncbi:MAG: ABC transporter substrate-binding protein [Ignavibacteriales bacterium]|nr:ABC transporter substrate-binding protein [Ignavibacteriales bacterium]
MRVLISILVLIMFTSAVAFTQSDLKKISFIPHWIPQAQFAGYFMAYEKGIYKKYGIDLKILTGGPNNPSSVEIEKGKVDFASLWLTNAIQLRDKGIKVINISQLVNKSALMLIAKKSSGIKTPQDMNGKKIGIWGGDFQIQPMAFFKKFNLDVKIIPQGSSINLFLMDGVNVTSAMWYNEYHTIINSGLNEDELSTFFFADYGLNFPEEGIYCLESTFKKDPKLCKDFILATLEGWKLAFEKSEEALNIVTKYMKAAKQPVNRAHERWMLNRMKDLIFPKKVYEKFEMLSQKDYEFVANKLLENKLIKKIPDFNLFYQPF